MIAGVAGGLADLWDADPSLIRIVWALLVVLTGGLALVVYIIMAIVVPDEDEVWPANGSATASAAGAPPAAATAAGDVTADTTTFGAPPAPPAAPAVDPATGQPMVSPTPAPGALWAAPPPTTHRQARADARAARRAARVERRGSGGATGAVIGGLLLVALGVFFLAREWLPQIDFDWFWPLMLIVLGVVVLVAAFGRRPNDPGPSA
jgi:phage shock protein C